MLDCHCHLDLYPDPSVVAKRAEAAGVFTVMVTNLPSAYQRVYPYATQHRRVRVALGLHPLLAEKHAQELNKFLELSRNVSFIGEIGLDFSAEGKQTAGVQVRSFERVLDALKQEPKFISVHSRRAEAAVLELLKSARRAPVVLHWYSGPLKILENAVADGHYFSINPAMVRSTNGQRIIAAIPRNRILSETDGPFVTVQKRPAEPLDVCLVEDFLSTLWKLPPLEVREVIADNFRSIVAPLRKSERYD